MRKLSELYDGVLLGNEDLTVVVTADMMREGIELGDTYEGTFYTLRIGGQKQGFTIVEAIEIDVFA